jgi:hypothetical protein
MDINAQTVITHGQTTVGCSAVIKCARLMIVVLSNKLVMDLRVQLHVQVGMHARIKQQSSVTVRVVCLKSVVRRTRVSVVSICVQLFHICVRTQRRLCVDMLNVRTLIVV